MLCRLDTFVIDGSLQAYTYKKTNVNLDFQSNVKPTKYNSIKGGDPDTPKSVEYFKPYSNVCGLLALAPHQVDKIDIYYQASKDAASEAGQPVFD